MLKGRFISARSHNGIVAIRVLRFRWKENAKPEQASLTCHCSHLCKKKANTDGRRNYRVPRQVLNAKWRTFLEQRVTSTTGCEERFS